MDKTVNQYVADALRLCGQMGAPGRGFSPEQVQEGAFFLNQMLDSWNTMRNALYTVSIAQYTLVSNLQYYLIGPGAVPTTIAGIAYGAFDAPRPQEITSANLIYQSAPLQLKIPLNVIDDWTRSNIRVPGIFSIPLELYFDGGYSQKTPTGLGSIFLWPGPQLGYFLELYTWQALTTVLEPVDTLFAPPGYARALTYNLALELPGSYRKELTNREEARVQKIADESKYWVESLNAPCEEASIDYPMSGRTGRSRFNWLSPLG
jgi:hypothetical protein